MEELPNHKSGIVSLVGKPNAGKSTLLNSFLEEKLVITSAKAQTTRHEITGIYNDPECQILFQDTPGLIEPDYKLHERMMDAAYTSLKDADIIAFIADVKEDLSQLKNTITELKEKYTKPFFLILNKTEGPKTIRRATYWKELFAPIVSEEFIIDASALEGTNIKYLLSRLKSYLPDHPPFYEKDWIATSKTRFFVAEFIRETIFEIYDKELPYQSTVIISQYKEKEDITVIYAEVVVYRESQKGIIIGKGGDNIKKLSRDSREKIEKFLGDKVFLDLKVKVRPNWRDKNNFLDEYGY